MARGCLRAGLAGLTAAYELRKAGYKVRVLEFQERIGGRLADATIAASDDDPHLMAPHCCMYTNSKLFIVLATSVGGAHQQTREGLGHCLGERRHQADSAAQLPS